MKMLHIFPDILPGVFEIPAPCGKQLVLYHGFITNQSVPALTTYRLRQILPILYYNVYNVYPLSSACNFIVTFTFRQCRQHIRTSRHLHLHVPT